MKAGIKETSEIIISALALLASAAEAKSDDGKVSRPEAVGILLSNAGEIWSALNGLPAVLTEIGDLDAEELDQLFVLVLASRGWERSESTEDIVRAVYDSVRQLLSTVRRIQYTIHPPAADPV